MIQKNKCSMAGKRSANFTLAEEEILSRLIRKYKNIMLNKETDAVSVKEKNETWELIGKEFNSQNSIYRDTKCLMRKYKNIVTTMKKKISTEKSTWVDTGNGPYKEIEYTNAEQILAPLMQKQLTGNPSEFDDDNDQTPTNHRLFNSTANTHSLSLDDYILEQDEYIEDDPLPWNDIVLAERPVDITLQGSSHTQSSIAMTNTALSLPVRSSTSMKHSRAPQTIQNISDNANTNFVPSINSTFTDTDSLGPQINSRNKNVIPRSVRVMSGSTTSAANTSEAVRVIVNNTDSSAGVSTLENNDPIASEANIIAQRIPTQTQSAVNFTSQEKNVSSSKNWQKLLKRNSTDVTEDGTMIGTHSKRRAGYQDKVSQWAAAKIALNQLQKQAFEEEQVLKRTLLEEKEKTLLTELVNEVKCRIDCNKAEHTLRTKLMKEKHDKEMEILELKKKALERQIS